MKKMEILDPIELTVSRSSIGAIVKGFDLQTSFFDPKKIDQIKEWLYQYKVVSFPSQELSLIEYEQFAGMFGKFCENPYLSPINEMTLKHTIRVERKRGEHVSDVPLYGGKWHSDFTMLQRPPDFTFLYSEIIPPVGGDTLFIDQQEVYQRLSDELKIKLQNQTATHTAELGWGIDGIFMNNQDKRTMKITVDQPIISNSHPIVRYHEHSYKPSLYVNQGFVSCIDNLDAEESKQVLEQLFKEQANPKLVYKLKWSPKMITIWDNRSVLHRATGGYDNYDRVLYRIVTYDEPLVC